MLPSYEVELVVLYRSSSRDTTAKTWPKRWGGGVGVVF